MPPVCAGRDLVGAVDLGVGDRARSAVTDGDRADPADHRDRLGGQVRVLAEEGLPGRDGEQVGAERGRACGPGRPGCEAEMPTTATIAAMPMAMPSADRNARSGRVRRPDRADPHHVGAAAAGPGVSVGRVSRPPADAPRSSRATTAAVAHLDLAGQAAGDLPVVGDDHDGGAGRVQLAQQRP